MVNVGISQIRRSPFTEAFAILPNYEKGNRGLPDGIEFVVSVLEKFD